MRSIMLCFLVGACGGDGGGPGTLDGGGGPGTLDGGGASCSLPTGGLYATFRHGNGEMYQAQITNPSGIDQAIAVWRGASTASIPSGELRCQAQPWNCGWSWHLDPLTVQFSDFMIEACDGIPSYVEAHCATFGPTYCPWSAQLVELRDCRSDRACPAVAR